MVKAIVDISDNANRTINIIKAEYGFKDKSEAINKMAQEYEEFVFEPKLKPSYIRKLRKIRKEPLVHIGTVNNFRKKYHLD